MSNAGTSTSITITIKISAYNLDNTFATGQNPRDRANGLPRAISLSLLDSSDKIIRTELILFAHSYDETILSALEAFPKHVSSNTPRGDISLKYRFRVNGTASWIGLRAAQRSPDTWKTLLPNGSEIVEIGVFVDITPGATHKAAEPIVGLDGKQLMACFTSTGLKWSDGVIRGCVPIPSTYEEGLDYVAEGIVIEGRPNITREEMRRGLRINVYDSIRNGYLAFNPADYRQVVQRYVGSTTVLVLNVVYQ